MSRRGSTSASTSTPIVLLRRLACRGLGILDPLQLGRRLAGGLLLTPPLLRDERGIEILVVLLLQREQLLFLVLRCFPPGLDRLDELLLAIELLLQLLLGGAQTR